VTANTLGLPDTALTYKEVDLMAVMLESESKPVLLTEYPAPLKGVRPVESVTSV